MKIFAVYDSKAEMFLTPFFSTTTATGIRVFESVSQNPQHPVAQSPADYTLFEIGDFDERKGFMTMHDAMTNLGLAINFQSSETM